MKIAVCGKGGCGKSTVTSLLAKALARRGKEILVIDSDESNYGLHRQLGMKLPRDFTDYFGGKQNVLNDMMLSKFTHQFFEETWTIDDIQSGPAPLSRTPTRRHRFCRTTPDSRAESRCSSGNYVRRLWRTGSAAP